MGQTPIGATDLVVAVEFGAEDNVTPTLTVPVPDITVDKRTRNAAHPDTLNINARFVFATKVNVPVRFTPDGFGICPEMGNAFVNAVVSLTSNVTTPPVSVEP